MHALGGEVLARHAHRMTETERKAALAATLLNGVAPGDPYKARPKGGVK